MKKLIALLLAVVMVMTVFAACGKEETPAQDDVTEEVTEVAAPASALEILENVWALYGEDEKFPAVGGDMSNAVDGAPGAFNVKDADAMTYQLLVPADQFANITEAASVCHMMNMNTFTCGVFRISGDSAAFAETMYNTVKGNQWMCGFPDSTLVSVIGGEYVLVAFGINDAMDPFEAKFQEAYPAAQIAYNEAIA